MRQLRNEVAMGVRELAGIIGLGVLLTVAVSQANNVPRIEPLGGGQSVIVPPGRPDIRPEHGPLVPAAPEIPFTAIPHGQMPPPVTTPFGSPPSPNQLTPAPVLPFHPNRPLMPSSAPPPRSGGGRLGR
jgi:hypothetical protein